MRELTASEASRNFSALLDAVEGGETIAVSRGGRRIAAIAPAEHDTWSGFADVVNRRRADRPIGDDELERNIADALTAVRTDLDVDPWAD
jgi:prevent-host-death family protein